MCLYQHLPNPLLSKLGRNFLQCQGTPKMWFLAPASGASSGRAETSGAHGNGAVVSSLHLSGAFLFVHTSVGASRTK